MTKVFISVGMSGRNTVDVVRDINRAINHLCNDIMNEDFDPIFDRDMIVTNFDCVPPAGSNQRLWCLGEAIKKLGECDICYFVKGWQKHKGCVIEHNICELYGIKIVEES
jgi:hypothetical protein